VLVWYRQVGISELTPPASREDRHQLPVLVGSGKCPIRHSKSERNADDGIAGGAAQIEIFSFRAVFQQKNKAFPLMQLALKIKRGEAAKMQIPLREQGVGGSNPLAPTISNPQHGEIFGALTKFQRCRHRGRGVPAVGCCYLLLGHPISPTVRNERDSTEREMLLAR
jgi:hypothetical protein